MLDYRAALALIPVLAALHRCRASRRESLRLCVPASQLTPEAFDEAGAELRLVKKAEAVISRRVGALVMVLERLHDGHNYCAVLRTMEALGVQNVWVVNPPAMESNNSIKRRNAVEMVQKATNTRTRRRAQERVDAIWEEDAKEDDQHASYAKRAFQWLTVREFESTADCIEALRESGLAIWVTALEQRADVLAPGAPWLSEANAVPSRLALVMGAEEAGVSVAFKAAADRLVYLPLSGFAESLNVSVAAALMTQLTLQLLSAAHPEQLLLTDAERRELRVEWYDRLARGNEEDRQKFAQMVDEPPTPFDDLRRPEAHRVHYTKHVS